MIAPKSCDFLPVPSNIVGIIHTAAGFREASKLKPANLDLLEIRVDAFAAAPERIQRLLQGLRLPLIITVRHPLEGGAQHLSPTARRRLFELFMPFATMIDVELRSAAQLTPVIQQARLRGIKVIFSHHDFVRTPVLKRLQELASRARQLKGDILKVATTVSSPGDLAVLLDFLHREKRIPLSVMGMGAFGKVSRLLFSLAGSQLNYGYLDKPQLKGQWPAKLLKQRLNELLA